MKIFETFQCSGHILSNFLRQFSNDKSISLQILYLSSVLWKIIPLYFCSSNNIYFAQKEPIKIKFLRISSACVKFCQILSNSLCQFWNDESILYQFCIRLQFHERLIVCSFLAQTIYTLLNRSPLKLKFLRLLSARVKFFQIPYANFERASRFLYKFCIPLQLHERLLLCSFLAQTIYTLLKRSPLKWKFLRLSSAWVKFCQIPYANFEMTSQFLSKFCIPLQFHER